MKTFAAWGVETQIKFQTCSTNSLLIKPYVLSFDLFQILMEQFSLNKWKTEILIKPSCTVYFTLQPTILKWF